jgi:hypothetical protein
MLSLIQGTGSKTRCDNTTHSLALARADFVAHGGSVLLDALDRLTVAERTPKGGGLEGAFMVGWGETAENGVAEKSQEADGGVAASEEAAMVRNLRTKQSLRTCFVVFSCDAVVCCVSCLERKQHQARDEELLEG